MSAERGREYVLTLSCPDKPGIVYAVSSFLVQHSANILASQQYGESPDGRFFMRVHFCLPPPGQQPAADLQLGPDLQLAADLQLAPDLQLAADLRLAEL